MPETQAAPAQHPHAPKMRQSLAQLERAFHHEAEQNVRLRLHTEREVAARTRARTRHRERKKSSMRFYVLTASLVVTAIVVTIAMLALLYALLV